MARPKNKYSLLIASGKSLVEFSIFCTLFLLLFSLSMNTPLDHDEHQFIASAKLFADNSLLPYIDYPYFHMPYLVFIYALLFKLSASPLIAARLFSVLCNLATLMLIFYTADRIFQSSKYLLRLLIGLGSLFILINNPLFLYVNNL
ncbi:MAG: hypothetical protein JW867_04145, partial [Candidatus Omnitrophica bacterium]|nr:hypothetical protein [Candidatus Omnitrophota bacterium]